MIERVVRVVGERMVWEGRWEDALSIEVIKAWYGGP